MSYDFFHFELTWDPNPDVTVERKSPLVLSVRVPLCLFVCCCWTYLWKSPRNPLLERGPWCDLTWTSRCVFLRANGVEALMKTRQALCYQEDDAISNRVGQALPVISSRTLVPSKRNSRKPANWTISFQPQTDGTGLSRTLAVFLCYGGGLGDSKHCAPILVPVRYLQLNS